MTTNNTTLSPREAALDVLTRYYAAFNNSDRPGMLELLTDDVAHDINQGGRETGRNVFGAFMARMDTCYQERLEDLTLFVDENGTRGAAEFTVHGKYLATDEGLPEAAGQTYVLPAGAFFTLRDGKIARVTMYYNLPDWTRQVEG